MDLGKAICVNYLPYAKTVITTRAIAAIDGLKPVQRRILYTMYTMGLINGNKVKSQDIVGTTMRLHPNGDSSIYDAMVLMGSGREQLNVPWIESKGNFGKVYSNIAHAAPRYTEAKLAAVSKELFDGINENAIDMVPNFDNSRKEPALLPVKFPSILVNSSNGIAVGTSSYIPAFGLKNVCNATIGRLNGTITDIPTLAETLGVPEFTTGAYIHSSSRLLQKLCETGKGSFVISSKVELYNSKIVVTEIPYNTTEKAIIDSIGALVKEKKISGIQEVRDETGLNGLSIVIELRKGYNTRDVLRQLYNMTPMRSTISFRTRVIVANDKGKQRCEEMGLMQVIDHWITFRRNCVKRIYEYRLTKQTEQEHLLSMWDKIKDCIPEILAMISSNTYDNSKAILISKYGLDDVQAEYLLDMKIRSITTDKAKAELEKLKSLREDIKFSTNIISNDSVKDKFIIDELKEIIDKYGVENKTVAVQELTPEDTEEKKVEISDENVIVVLTDTGFIKRLVSLKDMMGKYVSRNNDEEIRRWTIRNNQHMLVFDRFGVVHKVLVDNIDSSSKAPTDKLYELAGLEKPTDIIWVDACGDYSGYFNLVYPNGRGTRVYYNKATGGRNKYKGLYNEVENGEYWVTQENKFFMITKRRKATYVDIEMLGIASNRSAFKVARLSPGDYFTMLQPAKDVPNLGLIDLHKYYKDYTVAIKDDVLWVDPNAVERINKALDEERAKFAATTPAVDNTGDSDGANGSTSDSTVKDNENNGNVDNVPDGAGDTVDLDEV